MDRQDVVLVAFVHPLRASHASPSFCEGEGSFVSSPRLRRLDLGPSINSSVCPRYQAVGPEFGCLSCAVLHRSVSPELVL